MHYVPLRIHTDSSLLSSTIKPKKLIDFALENNIPRVAITDSNNLFAAAEFCFYAIKKKYPAILGCSIKTDQGIVTLYCKDKSGYQSLCMLVSDLSTEYSGLLPFAKLAYYSTGLVALSGGVDGVITSRDNFQFLYKTFGQDFALELNRTNGRDASESFISNLSNEYKVPVVGTSIAHFIDNPDAYQVVKALGENETVSFDNKDSDQTYRLLNQIEFEARFADCPIVVQNTSSFARKCAFLLAPTDPKFAFFADNAEQLLIDQVTRNYEQLIKTDNWTKAALKKFGELETAKKIYDERLKYELDMIIELGFTHYFLIVADFVRWAREQKISLSARGSGGGSLVAWALLIVTVDPIIFDLFFERFINPGRVSLPDFDIDFCQDRRHEVIEYVAQKYGRDMIAHIITFGLMHARGVLRDVGRVLGLPYRVIDGFCKRIPTGPNISVTLAEALESDQELQKAQKEDPKVKKLFDISLELEGIKRTISLHAAGIVIGYKPLREILPLYKTAAMHLPATGYTMSYIEPAGLVKFDFLGLTAMTIIDKTLAMIDAKIDINNIPMDDPKVFELINKGLTFGVFQFETAGLRDVALRVQATEIEDWIAIVALFRPGPIQYIPEFAARKHGTSPITYEYPELEPILKTTYGIIVYQEQVLAIAKDMAGYSLSEADLLRRAMGKKDPVEMQRNRTIFVQRFLERQGGSAEQAGELFDKIEKFSGYAFNKSHAACYAFIIYQNAYLKTYYTREFMTVSLTMERQKHDKISGLAAEFDELGLKLLPPNINRSKSGFAMEGKTGVRYALSAIKGVGDGFVLTGKYTSVSDFCSRAKPSKKIFEALVLTGALDEFSIYDTRSDTISGCQTSIESSDATTDTSASLIQSKTKALQKIHKHRNTLWQLKEQLLSGAGMGLFQQGWQEYFTINQLLVYEYKFAGVVFSKLPFSSSRPGFEAKIFTTYGLVVNKDLIKTRQGTTQWAIKLADNQGVYEVFMRNDLEAKIKVKEGQILKIKSKKVKTFWIAEEAGELNKQTLVIHVISKEQIRQIYEILKTATQSGPIADLMLSINNTKITACDLYLNKDLFDQLDAISVRYRIAT